VCLVAWRTSRCPLLPSPGWSRNTSPRTIRITNQNTIMLTKATALTGYRLDGLDGEIGELRDFYFDDRKWAIRYLVADTGDWLTGRQVLLSPCALAAVIHKAHAIAINLTQQQIEDSPELRCNMPVSRQTEEAYHGYFGWPKYWADPYMRRSCPNPVHEGTTSETALLGDQAGDLQLHNTAAVSGYEIQAGDGDIGNVEDFIIDDVAWAIRYLIVDTRNWWPGKKVLVAPQWIERVSWNNAKVFVDLPSELPEYYESRHNNCGHDTRLQQSYHRENHWTSHDPLHARMDGRNQSP